MRKVVALALTGLLSIASGCATDSLPPALAEAVSPILFSNEPDCSKLAAGTRTDNCE